MRDMLRRALRWFAAAAAPEPLEIAVLKIHDLKYNITVDLDDGINTAIARGGWSQAGPNLLPGGIWGDVDEAVKVSLLTTDNAVYGKLARMAARVEELKNPMHEDYLTPGKKIAVEARTPDEATSRWALLSDLAVEKMDPAHYRAGGRLSMPLKFTREGLWRGQQPGETPVELLPYSTLTTGTKLEIVNDGYLGSNPVQGDSPPFLRLDIRTYFDVWVAIISNATENEFTPFFWPSDIYGSPTLTAISSLPSPFDAANTLPGGYCLRVAPSPPAGGSVKFQLNLADYFGYFSVYALALSNATATLRFSHFYDGGGSNYGQPVSVAFSTGHWGIHPLGTFRIPYSGGPVDGVFPTATYFGSLDFSVISGSLYIGGMFLVPESTPPHIVRCYGADEGSPITRVNAETQTVYWTASGVPTLVPSALPFGPFPTINPAPGRTNNLFFVPVTNPHQTNVVAALPPVDTDWRIGVRHIPRWQYLNELGL